MLLPKCRTALLHAHYKSFGGNWHADVAAGAGRVELRDVLANPDTHRPLFQATARRILQRARGTNTS
jgi:hypothetical protein